MGATDFYHSIDNTTDANAAFRKAQEEAEYEHGHSGYTGTIAEKTSFRCIATADTYEQACDMAYKMISLGDPRIDDKWGPAGAIKFLRDDKVCWLFFGLASC